MAEKARLVEVTSTIIDDLTVISMPFDDFYKWFQTKWEQGQHVALLAQTGAGKTTFVSAFLPMRKYVMVLDAKGGDSSLAKLLDKGFVHSAWPPDKQIYKDIEEGKPARLLIGGNVRNDTELPRLRKEIGLALGAAFNDRGWTVYVDELQLVCDRRFMNLGAPIERILIAARDRKVSLITSFQRPANVPKSASEMSTWFMVYYTRDRDVVHRLAEMAGRPAEQMQGLVRALPPFCVLVFSRNPRDPIIVTKADL